MMMGTATVQSGNSIILALLEMVGSVPNKADLRVISQRLMDFRESRKNNDWGKKHSRHL
jgi:hypothetical protein